MTKLEIWLFPFLILLLAGLFSLMGCADKRTRQEKVRDCMDHHMFMLPGKTAVSAELFRAIQEYCEKENPQ